MTAVSIERWVKQWLLRLNGHFHWGGWNNGY